MDFVILATAIFFGVLVIVALIANPPRTAKKMSPDPTPSLHIERAETQIRNLKRDNRSLALENQRLHEELTQLKKDRIRLQDTLAHNRKDAYADSLAQAISNQTGISAAEVRRVMAGGGVSTPEGEHLQDPLTPADKYRGTSIRYVRRVIQIEDDA